MSSGHMHLTGKYRQIVYRASLLMLVLIVSIYAAFIMPTAHIGARPVPLPCMCLQISLLHCNYTVLLKC